MDHQDLLQERVAQLKTISDRRNVLLREMYYLIQLRNNAGHSLSLAQQDEDDDLHVFLQRFDLNKDPESGSIANFNENELVTLTQNICSRPASTVPSPASVQSPERTPEREFVDVDAPSDAVRTSPPPETVEVSLRARHSKSKSPAVISPKADEESDDELDLLKSYNQEPVSAGAAVTSPNRTPSPEVVDLADDLADGEGEIDMDEDVDVVSSPKSVIEVVDSPKQPSSTKDNEVIGQQGSPLANHDTEDQRMVVDEITVDDVEDEGLESTTVPQTPQDWPPQSSPPLELSATSADLERDGILKRNASPGAQQGLNYAPEVIQQLQPSTIPSVFPVFSIFSPKPVIIAAPTTPLTESTYNFGTGDESSASVQQSSVTPTLTYNRYRPEYTLPPLKLLPAEYNRKIKTKQRKRDKEREKSEGKKDTGKDDWAPMGLNRWTATITANPVWKRVSRATKCLSSREWGVAMTELRLVRAVDRIETLKNAGRWSFRQPKKQRGIGGLTKSHWDYLMDEMKWMRIDFREERRWKMALAYNLSTSVLEWHAAGNQGERLAHGIVVRWKRLQPSDKLLDAMEDVEITVEDPMQLVESQEQSPQPPKSSLLGLDYGSEDEDEDEQDREVMDALQPSTLLEEALDASASMLNVEGPEPAFPEMKMEDPDDEGILRNPDQTNLELPQNTINAAPKLTGDGEQEGTFGLKSTSSDPVLGSDSTIQFVDRETSITPAKPGAKSNLHASIREQIAHSDDTKLFLDFAELHIDDSIFPQISESRGDAVFPPKDFFLDMQPYGMLDVAPVVVPVPVEGKKKSGRNDRDDPNKRAEDVTYTKLFPTGQFMHGKATLVGPLIPSKRWKDGVWSAIEEPPITPDPDSGIKISEESQSDLFENRSSNAAAMLYAMQWQAAMSKERDSRRKPSDHIWTASDDALLKSFIDKYPYNWYLIAECFNASRITIATDKRTPRDCLERWREKWGADLRLRQQDANNAPPVEGTPPPTTNQSQMTTRGVKRLASSSVSSPTLGTTPSGGEPRKRRRHTLLQDTIRKYTKKRIETLQKANTQRKPSVIHETHGQLAKMPKLSPAELIRLKAEKDARDYQELLAKKKQAEEYGRQAMQAKNQLLQQQQQQQQAQQPQAQQPQTQQQPQQSPHQTQATPQQQQQQASSTAIARPPSIGIPTTPQNVPQIRSQQVNISQQQRLAAALANASARLSPSQLQVHAQQTRAMGQASHHAQVQALAQNFAQQLPSQVQNANQTATGVSISPPHMSTAFVNRDAASSPGHLSPPHNTVISTNATGSPRPASAQAHAQSALLQHVAGTAGLTRTASMGGGYYQAAGLQGFTAEQLGRLQMMTSQHAQQAGQQTQLGNGFGQ
ncbi:hypothetical protein AMATHDRAFT_60687 [Amanita thiersii Skay4041]|uniref:Vacuolar import and degradation protein 21 n=1 Tax=Amanita thiersii Skay4041 TaxID=703135 RepID=A0A2A9NR09_9AGAR|nr:hypothetical protein AMATHDRAFT_60687 [Amanita thiersii Skay4041]